MNDRFRFRVFYKPHNKIYNVICLNSDRQKEIIIEYKGSTALVKWENCDILQCTGLKDKNGKLIYEGDIVEKSTFIDYNGNGYQPDVYLDRVDIGVVHFTASNGAILRKVKTFLTDNPYKEREPLPKKDQPKIVKLFACRSEIIGNRYQNPELLEEEWIQ